MEDYLSMYGWHFSKKLCDWAVSRMKKRVQGKQQPEPLQPHTKDQVEDLLKRHNIDSSGFIGYDHVYVCNMAKADFVGSSIPDEQHLALFVKDYMCDVDGYDEVAMTRFYADCIGRGEQIPWEDVI